jgi:hypothetical protein
MNQTQDHPSKLKKKKNSNGPKSIMDTNTVIVGDLNAPVSPTDRSSRQKINKETLELLHTLDQIDMVDILQSISPNN